MFSLRNIRLGITYIELSVLVILCIFLVLCICILNQYSIMEYRLRSNRAIIGQLSVAITLYKEKFGRFPPDHISYGGQEEGARFKYRNDILIKYLRDYPKYSFFNFKEYQIVDNHIFVDEFHEPFWYHNFEDDEKESKRVISEKYPLHPWENAISGFQIYTKGCFNGKNIEDAYDGIPSEGNFVWMTNYHDNVSSIIDKKQEAWTIVCVVISLILLFFIVVKILDNIKVPDDGAPQIKGRK